MSCAPNFYILIEMIAAFPQLFGRFNRYKPVIKKPIMLTILITGGTGVIGRELSDKLRSKGYRVAILSRTTRKNTDIAHYYWDPDKKIIEKEALETADYIIHLAGANIGDKKWSKQRREQIINSRIQSANLLHDKISEASKKPKAFISASAIGYYGTTTSDKIFCETDPPGNDFLGETCRLWEHAADNFEKLGIRTVKIRTGIVLSKQGGVLAKMSVPTKLGIGSAIGSGRQYMPWIHIDDLCGIYVKALEDTQMNGAYNAVAPNQPTNKDFMQTLAHVLKKPFWAPAIPSLPMRIIFGQMSSLLLEGSRISPEKIIASGYNFLFPSLESALTDLLAKK